MWIQSCHQKFPVAGIIGSYPNNQYVQRIILMLCAAGTPVYKKYQDNSV